MRNRITRPSPHGMVLASCFALALVLSIAVLVLDSRILLDAFNRETVNVESIGSVTGVTIGEGVRVPGCALSTSTSTSAIY